MNLRFHPNALIVGVTSGKGGVGKSTTAVALAAAFSADGKNVVLADLDVTAPNVHLIADVTDFEVKGNKETLTLTLPESDLGFKVASPLSILNGGTVDNTLRLIKYVDGVDVIVVDLPGGWSNAHTSFMEMFPHAVVTVAAPTIESAADHKRTIDAFVHGRDKVREDLVRSDARRNWDKVMPDAPKRFLFETMARFTGTTDDGDVVTIRRSDVENESFVPNLAAETDCEFVGSIPGGNIRDLAELSVITEFVAAANELNI